MIAFSPTIVVNAQGFRQHWSVLLTPSEMMLKQGVEQRDSNTCSEIALSNGVAQSQKNLAPWSNRAT
jgi:hypothetical protein